MQAQTIDRCQGDEADAVVLSLVMSYNLDAAAQDSRKKNPLTNPHGVPALSPHSARSKDAIIASDFVQYANRANVAISRARYALVVVSSDSIEHSMKFATQKSTVWGRVLKSKWRTPHARQLEPSFVVQQALRGKEVLFVWALLLKLTPRSTAMPVQGMSGMELHVSCWHACRSNCLMFVEIESNERAPMWEIVRCSLYGAQRTDQWAPY
jgi:hypothetical protein